MTKGYWIAIDGIDAVGKSTQVYALAEILRNKGFPKVSIVTEFSDSPIGKTILNILDNQRFYALNNSKTTPLADTMILVADMLYHWETIIYPTISTGGIVISDRGPSSLVSYQAIRLSERSKQFTLDKAFDWISQLVNHSFLKPDITLILDISEKEMISRIRNRETDPLKESEIKFLNDVHDLISQTSRLSNQFLSLSGEGSIAEVTARIEDNLKSVLFF